MHSTGRARAARFDFYLRVEPDQGRERKRPAKKTRSESFIHLTVQLPARKTRLPRIDLPENLPAKTPISIRFRYEENGRLTVGVKVAGTDHFVHRQLSRENRMSQDELDWWRRRMTQGRHKGEL